MPRTLRLTFQLLIAAFAAIPASAQVATGAPHEAFMTFAGVLKNEALTV
jgi:hypothetical protein